MATNGQPTHRTHTHIHTLAPQPLMALNTQPTHRTRHTQFRHTQARHIQVKYTQVHPQSTHAFTHTVTEPPSAETRNISKQYFKLIQATHHKYIIDKAIATQSFPPGMMRQVNRLTDFIKPAAPTQHTRTRVADNTTTWMKNNMTILQEHYSSTITSLSDTPKDPLALQIAIGWARKRYGPKLTPETIHTVEHTLDIPLHSHLLTNPQPSHPPPPPLTANRITRPLTSIQEKKEEEDFPALPTSQAPHKLSLYLGPRSSLAEEVSRFKATEPTIQHTSTTQTTTICQPAEPAAQTTPTPAPRRRTPAGRMKPSPTPALTENQAMAGCPPVALPDNPVQGDTGPHTVEQQEPATQCKSPSIQCSENNPPHPGPVYPSVAEKETDTHTSSQAPTPPPLNASTPLPQRTTRNRQNKPGQDTMEPQPISPNPQLSPVIPVITRGTATQLHISPSLLPPQQPAKDNIASLPATHPCGTPPKTLTRMREVGVQVHAPPQTQPVSTPDLETITLSISCNESNVAVITHDSISPFCLSPTDCPGEGASRLERQVTSEHTKKTESEGKNIMMSGTLKANMAALKAQSEPSTQQVCEALPPSRPDPITGTSVTNNQCPMHPPGPSISLFQPSNTPPLPANFKPTYHIARSHRRLQDWHFKPRKPVVILGDSNINRIPPHQNPEIQLDSYPGANMYQFLKLCEKSPVSPSTKILVLSIGINNKDQDPKQTSIKQLKALYRQARTTFPNADIYFPIMNFSPHLTQTQQENLKLINNTIATHLPFLAEIPHDTFMTETDNIHWTTPTAQHIFQYWCKQLNLPSV